ncbi:hypothetical protein Q4E93_10035 [Flavitalea sp. BT771]|uniref:hypothetical protein n=1 Tax=Flavitalea sp. BT771 TaxID=3063329 RepID=UPI0026E1E7F8|nr:hypothetical protein [Flavitalea sp. BT771]MDO6430927.1 hypothetical protein [Flavitalea sp. BT771]MDV6218933.1 hypothetical protein [Flavitalea sp. BT771]
MENKPRYLTICSNNYYHPKIFVQGRYLEDYGFEVGAQVTLTNPESGTLIIRQTKSREKHMQDKKRHYLMERKVELEKELSGFIVDRKKKEAELISIRQELGDAA